MNNPTAAEPRPLSCSSCGTDLHGHRWNWMCCGPCEDWIRDQLNTIEHLWQELPTHLVPRSRGPRPWIGERLVRAPQAGRIPLSEEVLSLLCPGGVVDRLAQHDAVVRVARGGTGDPWPGTPDARLGATIRSLRRHLPWAAEHVDLWDLASGLRALVGEMKAAVRWQDDTPPATRTLRQRCPALHGDGTECGGALVYDTAARTIACADCGTAVDRSRWLALAAARWAA